MMNNSRIRNLRENSNLTQSTLATYLNVSQRTYSRYENAERMIPPAILSLLADYYHTSVDYLIERTDEKQPYPKSKNKGDYHYDSSSYL